MLTNLKYRTINTNAEKNKTSYTLYKHYQDQWAAEYLHHRNIIKTDNYRAMIMQHDHRAVIIGMLRSTQSAVMRLHHCIIACRPSVCLSVRDV